MQISDKIRDWIKGQLNIRVQWLKGNPCYLWARDKHRVREPRGVMVHSTGADNPNLRRYVAPDDGQLGKPSSRHWNQPNGEKCVHAFIGKLANGGVAVYQTLPWTYEGWHCAGRANRTHIGFECCEDGLDPDKLECWLYFQKVYEQAALLTAHLCARYHLDPRKPGVVICHAEGHRLGLASNHADVLHWWPRFGRDMDDFRRDVWSLMQGKQIPAVEIPSYLLPKPTPAPEKNEIVEEDEDMTEDKIREIIRDEMTKRDRQAAESEAPGWAKKLGTMEKAVALGISAKGDRPNSNITRAEAYQAIIKATEKKED